MISADFAADFCFLIFNTFFPRRPGWSNAVRPFLVLILTEYPPFGYLRFAVRHCILIKCVYKLPKIRYFDKFFIKYQKILLKTIQASGINLTAVLLEVPLPAAPSFHACATLLLLAGALYHK